ncbi:MAG: hypothetical protein ABWY36_02705 [Leifsonia sp.]
MRNFFSSQSTSTRSAKSFRSKLFAPVLTAGAIVAVGALVGTGFVLHSTVVAQNERLAATAELAQSTGLHSEQLAAHGTVLVSLATQKAETAIQGANATIAAAQGKADAAALSTTVATLAHYDLLAPERVFALASDATAKTAAVQAAVVEFDRVAAEKAAAEAAAAAKAAADAKASASGSTAASSGSRPAAPSNPSEAQAIARDMLPAFGWGDDQFGCLVALWGRESGWNANAYNASSGAGGIPQALPASKMASAGADWQTNPATQIRWGLGYIAGRYGSPCGAWDTSEAQGWY